MLSIADSPTPLTADEHRVIAAVVDQAPPLSQGTRAKLAALLTGARSDAFTDKLRTTINGGAR